jgi:hypothetical protein
VKLKLLVAVAAGVMLGPLLLLASNASADAARPTPAAPAPPAHLTDAQKGAPGVPEVEEPVSKPHTLREMQDEINPTHSKNVVVTQRPDGNFRVAYYDFADGNVPLVPAPPGGYQSLDLSK